MKYLEQTGGQLVAHCFLAKSGKPVLMNYDKYYDNHNTCVKKSLWKNLDGNSIA